MGLSLSDKSTLHVPIISSSITGPTTVGVMWVGESEQQQTNATVSSADFKVCYNKQAEKQGFETDTRALFHRQKLCFAFSSVSVKRLDLCCKIFVYLSCTHSWRGGGGGKASTGDWIVNFRRQGKANVHVFLVTTFVEGLYGWTVTLPEDVIMSLVCTCVSREWLVLWYVWCQTHWLNHIWSQLRQETKSRQAAQLWSCSSL